MSAQLDAVLAEKFAGSTLQPPAFGDLPFVRFELGDELDGPERIEQAVARASAIFEALFSPADRAFVVAFFWKAGDEEMLRQLVPAEFDRAEGKNFWDDPDGDDRFTRLVARVSPMEVDHRAIFRLIANRELGVQPSIGAKIFVVGETLPAIFEMYDDRGAIVHSAAPEHLSRLEDLRAWEVRPG